MRLFEDRLEKSSSSRSYSGSDGSELILSDAPATETLRLSRGQAVDAEKNGIPKEWRFAVGAVDSTEVELTIVPSQIASQVAAAAPPTAARAQPTFADVQRDAAATAVQAAFRRNQGQQRAQEMRVERRFLNRRNPSMEVRTISSSSFQASKHVS